MRIAGNRCWTNLATRVQTDGSFQSKLRLSRTAVLIPDTKESFLNTYFDHANSTESEWCSVLDGLKRDLPLVNLENDSLGVMNSLILRKPPKKDYLQYYFYEIMERAEELDWFAVRWVPRKLNRADDLF